MPKLQPFERKNERKMSNVSHKIYKNTILLLIQKLKYNTAINTETKCCT